MMRKSQSFSGRSFLVGLSSMVWWPLLLGGEELSDCEGFRWDVNNMGGITDGSNDTFDNGVLLETGDGNQCGSSGMIKRSGQELIVGPMRFCRGLNVTRRILVPPKKACIRYFEVIENPGDQTVKIHLRLRSNLGSSPQGTVKSDSQAKRKQFGVVGQGSGRSCVGFLFADGRSPIRGDFEGNNGQNVIVRFIPEITIPPKGQVGLLHVVVQRNSIEAAADFLKTLKFREFLKDIPKEEWGKIINVRATAGLFSLDDIGVFQPTKNDAILLSSGEWLTGTFKGERLRLTTDFGERDFPRKDVLCLLGSDHGTFKAVSRQGEVLTATLQEPALDFALDRGDPLRIPWKHVAKLGLALPEISPPRPKPSPPIVPISNPAPTSPTLAKTGPDQPSALSQPGEEETDHWFEFTHPIFILRNKDRVIGEPRQKEITIHTLFGTQVFPLKALAKITFPSADQPFPEIRLSDGSALVGLMKDPSFEVLLANGQNALLAFDRLEAVFFQVKELEGLEAKGPGKQNAAFLKLWNGDVLAGQFLGGQGVLDFQTPFGTQKLDAVQIKEIRFRPEGRPECRVTFWDDSALPGRFTCPSLPFHSSLAGVIPIPLGLVELYRCPGALPPIEKRKEIEGLVEKLGHEESAIRESAQKTLLEMGPTIQGVLQTHLPHKDPEIQKRVLKLLKTFRPADQEGIP